MTVELLTSTEITKLDNEGYKMNIELTELEGKELYLILAKAQILFKWELPEQDWNKTIDSVSDKLENLLL